MMRNVRPRPPVTHSYEFAFLASFVGGLVAAGIVHLLDKFVAVPTVTFIDVPVIAYPHALRLRVASYAVFCAWALLLLSLALLGLAVVNNLSYMHSGIWTFA